jgi:hypothetical protein
MLKNGFMDYFKPANSVTEQTKIFKCTPHKNTESKQTEEKFSNGYCKVLAVWHDCNCVMTSF